MSSRAELPQLLTEREVAKLMGLSARSIKRRRAEGLPHYCVGGSIRYNPAEVLAWLNGHGRGQASGGSAMPPRRGRPRRPVTP